MSLLLAIQLASAFSPAVHRALAERAAELEGRPDVAERFALGAADEDWNLLRKWTRWHHYHSPTFPVRSAWRGPSERRVGDLDARIRVAVGDGDIDRAWLLAGQLAHHVQDMASPPHVVPVAHGPFDSFETYVTRALVETIRGGEVPTVTGAVAHQALAENTVRVLGVDLECDTGPLPWTDFWAPRPGGFGAYGAAGNRFGAVPGCEAGSLAFATGRIDAALAYTRAIVRFVAAL